MGNIILLLLAAGFDFILWLYTGFVLMKLWKWFIVPTFHVSPISYIAAAGIAIIYSVLSYRYQDADEEDDKAVLFGKMLNRFITYLIVGLFALIMGAILKSFL